MPVLHGTWQALQPFLYTLQGRYYTRTNDLTVNKRLLNFLPCFSFCCCFILWLHSVGFYILSPAPPVIMRFSWTDREEEDMFVFWQHPKDSLNKCMTGVTLFHSSVWRMSPVLSCDGETHCYIKSSANHNRKYKLNPPRLKYVGKIAFTSKCIYFSLKGQMSQ